MIHISLSLDKSYDLVFLLLNQARMLTMMKQLSWLIPLIRPKLPGLTSSHHANNTIPGIRAELPKRLCRIYNEVSCLCLSFSAWGINVYAFAVDGDKIVGSGVAFCGSASSGVLWRFKAEMGGSEEELARGGRVLHWFLKEPSDVVHGDEGCWRWWDHYDWIHCTFVIIWEYCYVSEMFYDLRDFLAAALGSNEV